MSDYSKWDGIQDPDDEPDATLLPAREPVQGPRRKPGRPGGKALPTWAGPFWTLLVVIIQLFVDAYRRCDAFYLRMRGLPPRAGPYAKEGAGPDMPDTLKKKVEKKMVGDAKSKEPPKLPEGMRKRPAVHGREIADAAAAHATGEVGLPGLPKRDPGAGIPHNRDELYARPIDYERMERGRVVVDKMAPWVEKQVIENFGASVPRLVNMICSKIAQREPAVNIETELIKVMDDDAYSLTVRLWALLHYEIECVPARPPPARVDVPAGPPRARVEEL